MTGDSMFLKWCVVVVSWLASRPKGALERWDYTYGCFVSTSTSLAKRQLWCCCSNR
jgi:hypothetical protein